MTEANPTPSGPSLSRGSFAPRAQALFAFTGVNMAMVTYLLRDDDRLAGALSMGVVTVWAFFSYRTLSLDYLGVAKKPSAERPSFGGADVIDLRDDTTRSEIFEAGAWTVLAATVPLFVAWILGPDLRARVGAGAWSWLGMAVSAATGGVVMLTVRRLIAHVAVVRAEVSEFLGASPLRRRVAVVGGAYTYAALAFAAVYSLIARSDAKAFDSSIDGYFDALYFSVITLATVGYGDVHPVSVAAKAAVMLEILSGLTMLTFVLSVVLAMGGAAARPRRL